MTEIRAEMVANVWKVLVTKGQAVEAGDTLVILESMKMELPVVTDVAGTVTKVTVVAGGSVQDGDVIAVVD